MNGIGVPAASPKLPEANAGNPVQFVLLNTPVSPSPCPVAMAEALAIVNVGNS